MAEFTMKRLMLLIIAGLFVVASALPGIIYAGQVSVTITEPACFNLSFVNGSKGMLPTARPSGFGRHPSHPVVNLKCADDDTRESSCGVTRKYTFFVPNASQIVAGYPYMDSCSRKITITSPSRAPPRS
jgi:hypothetical protein